MLANVDLLQLSLEDACWETLDSHLGLEARGGTSMVGRGLGHGNSVEIT